MKLFQFPVAPGNRLEFSDAISEVISVDYLRGQAVLRRLSDNSLFGRSMESLLAGCMDGSIKVFDKNGLALRVRESTPDVLGMSKQQQRMRDMRLDYVKEVTQCGGPKNPLFREVVNRLNKKYTKNFSCATVYGWKRRHEKNQDDNALAFEAMSRKSKTPRMAKRVAAVVFKALDELNKEYDALLKGSTTLRIFGKTGHSGRGIYRHVRASVAASAVADQVPIPEGPSLRTIQRLLDNGLDRWKVLAALFGTRVARKQLGPYLGQHSQDRIGARCEMDFFIGNVVLGVRFKGVWIPLGRPVLTVIIDVGSRAILAIVVEFNTPNTNTVLAALKMAMQPKTQLWADFPEIRNKVDTYVVMETLVYDNAWVFEAKDFLASMKEVNTILMPANVKAPQEKPHIESLGGSIDVEFMPLHPGHVQDVLTSRKLELNAWNGPFMDMREFLGKLYQWWFDIYMVSAHSGIGNLTPQQKWFDSLSLLSADPSQALFPLSKLELDYRVGRRFSGQCDKDGIRHDRRLYNSPALNELWRTSKKTFKFDYRVDPLNLNSIVVINPKTGEPFRVPAREELPAGMTLNSWARLRMCQRLLSSENIIAVQEATAKIVSSGDSKAFNKLESEPQKLLLLILENLPMLRTLLEEHGDAEGLSPASSKTLKEIYADAEAA